MLEANIRRRAEGVAHAVTAYLTKTIVQTYLGVIHLIRAEALAH